jgi:hypothetical protein
MKLIKIMSWTQCLFLAPSNDIAVSKPKNVAALAGAALIIHTANPGKNARIPP